MGRRQARRRHGGGCAGRRRVPLGGADGGPAPGDLEVVTALTADLGACAVCGSSDLLTLWREEIGVGWYRPGATLCGACGVTRATWVGLIPTFTGV